MTTNGQRATTGTPRLADLDDVLTAEEVAGFLKCATSTVYDLCRDGRMPAHKVGRLVRIPKAGLLVWLDGESRPVRRYRDAQGVGNEEREECIRNFLVVIAGAVGTL